MTDVTAPEPLQRIGDRLADLAHLADPRPRLRGHIHLVAAFLSVGGLAVLVASATSGQAKVAAWIYGLAGILVYTTSSTYHVFARSPRARKIMQALDHAMIYVLIAGTFTPICILAMSGTWRWFVLGGMWVGAATGMTLALVALDRFNKITFALYLVLGWAGLVSVPTLIEHPRHLILVGIGGGLYTVGAVLFALHMPRLKPDWFGYHELWHTFGVIAGALFFAVNYNLINSAGLS